MNHLPKTIMMIGVAIFVVGFLMHFIKIGRLPGDILFKKGNTTFYFPIMTSIIVSILLSVFFYIISRFK